MNSAAALDDVLHALADDAAPDAGAAFARLTAEYLERNARGDGPVSSLRTPADLARRFDESLPSAMRPLADVLARIDADVLSDVNRLSHPMYMGHQVSAPLPAAIWTESLTAAINNSVAVGEMSPAGTAIETRVLRWMCDLAGFGSAAGGTFTSGGTEATFTALLAARAQVLPGAWQDGVGDDAPIVICGEHAHYAVTRAVAQLGLGMRRVIAIPSREYCMDSDALAARLNTLSAGGTRVMAVVATAGSTATGSFDDLDTIGRLCEARDIWFHVDGAHGASALLSDQHRHRLRGIERARSIAWDPHKMMLMPLGAGMLLVSNERELDAAFAQRAPYLFHGEGRVADQGVRSFLCSRPVDALKVWVALQRYGSIGIGVLYDHLAGLAAELYRLIESRPDFEALHAPESNILCFRHVGSDEQNRLLRERYNGSGAGWITTTVLDGRRVLRVTMMNARTTPAHLTVLLDGLAATAAAM
ncbi:MAG: aspartate aminotransferase family protein [Gemmatimonadota bacterium]